MTFKLDSNHKEIVKAFQRLGAYVVDNAQVERYEAGQLDLWVGLPNPYGPIGIWLWVEVKTDEGQLKNSQKTKIAECTEMSLPVEVARSTMDVEEIYYRWLAIMQAGGCKCDCGNIIPIGEAICNECIPF